MSFLLDVNANWVVTRNGQENTKVLPVRLLVTAIILFAMQLLSPAVRAQGEFPTDADCELLVEPVPGRHLPAGTVMDGGGTIHLFWKGFFSDSGQPPGKEDPLSDINYRRWDGTTWSPIYNIVHTAEELQGAPVVTIDEKNVIHMLWEDNGIQYSQSPAYEAHLAHTWLRNAVRFMEPLLAMPALAAAASGSLYVIAPTYQGTLVLLKSPDGGRTWSKPSYVAEPRAAPGAPERAQYVKASSLVVDNSGYLHVVYASYPKSGYPALGLFYIRSGDDGITWSDPFILAPARHDHARLVVLESKDLLVVWDGDAATKGRYARTSRDGGLTWSDMETILPPSYPGGLTGSPGVAMDSAGRVHVLMGSDDWAYYNSWDGGSWSGPRRMPICQSYWTGENQVEAKAQIEARGASPLEVGSTSLLVTEGNRLHAIWEGFALGIVHVSWRVDAPPRAMSKVHPIPSATPTENIQETLGNEAAVIPTISNPAATRVLARGNLSHSGGDLRAAWSPLVVGILPAILLIGVIIVVAGSRRRGRTH